MDDIKFCKNCKWYKRRWLTWEITVNICNHPDIENFDIVTGEKDMNCYLIRNRMCGIDGKYWEAKNV